MPELWGDGGVMRSLRNEARPGSSTKVGEPIEIQEARDRPAKRLMNEAFTARFDAVHGRHPDRDVFDDKRPDETFGQAYARVRGLAA